MNDSNFQEFDDASYSKYRRRLLRAKWGGVRQRAFLRTVAKGRALVQDIRASVDVRGSETPPLHSEPLTESEFKQPPPTTEEALYKSWSNLTPRIACRTSFWANLTCRHIDQGHIQASYLAATGRGGQTGAQRIDRLLQGRDDKSARAIRGCVLDILRRLGGIPEYRGNRTVYVNCPFARAWWRERLVSEVSAGDEDLADSVRQVVTRVNQTYWEELVVLVVSRNSVLGASKVRNQFILGLARLFERHGFDTPLRIATHLRSACQSIGIIHASRELSVLDDVALRDLMDRLIHFHHDSKGIGVPNG